MTRQEICRIVSGTLVVLIGIAIGFGGFQLRNGVPQSWPDVIAADSTTRIVAKGMMALAGLLAVTGAAAIINLGWGYLATMIAIAIFVAGGFWANYVLFGDITSNPHGYECHRRRTDHVVAMDRIFSPKELEPPNKALQVTRETRALER